MLRLLPVLCLVLIFGSPSCAQDATTDDTAGESVLVNALNFRLQAMRFALNESGNLESDLELIDDQRNSLEKLSSDYRQMVQSFNDLENTEGGMQAGLALCLRELDTFEKRLSSDILLPHQSAALRSMVFAKLVKDQGGDLVSALTKYYPNELKLDASQKKRMKEIKSSSADKIEKAKQEFREKLKQIALETETEVRRVLTPNQKKMFSELQGRTN